MKLYLNFFYFNLISTFCSPAWRSACEHWVVVPIYWAAGAAGAADLGGGTSHSRLQAGTSEQAQTAPSASPWAPAE